MTHTPTPWEASHGGYGGWKQESGFNGVIVGRNEEKVYAGPSSFKSLKAPEGNPSANANRIVAAVNFFHGRDIPTENIPESGFWVMADALDKARKAFIRIQNEGDAHSNGIATKCLNRIEP